MLLENTQSVDLVVDKKALMLTKGADSNEIPHWLYLVWVCTIC